MSKISKIIVPAFDNKGNSLESVIDSTAKELCKAFGGATVIDARGYWVNNNDMLYNEPVKIIESAAPMTKTASKKLRDLALSLLAVTDQEAVFVQYANQEVEIVHKK